MILTAPDDPNFSLQWGIQNTGQTISFDFDGRHYDVSGTTGADINAVPAWGITTGSEEIVLAVLDTGIALNHPEFSGRIVEGYDFVNDRPDPMDDAGHGTAVASVVRPLEETGA